MSSNKNIAQPGLAETEAGRKERAYLAAAHRDDRSEQGKQESLEKAETIHEKRTGETLDGAALEKKPRVDQPGLADTEEGRKERSLLGAAHREGRDEEKKLESLQKASKLHEERTGEPLEEAVEKGVAEADDSKEEQEEEEEGSEKKSNAEQPGLAETEEGRQERAYIAAAHRKHRDAESKAESLAKASELHEQRTGEPLAEAVEKGIVDENGEALNKNGKRPHEDDRQDSDKKQKNGKHVEHPGLAETHEGRQERAFIAAAHRDGRSEEGKLESLKKASDLHEKRTGQPLEEAVQSKVAAP